MALISKKHKLYIILLAASLCFLLSGCGILSIAENLLHDERYDDPRFHRREDYIFDEMIKALDNKDEDALKALFSENARTSISDFDAKITEYVDFYNGKMISIDSKGGYERGMMGDYFQHHYDVVTDEGAFAITFYYTARDEEFTKKNKKDISPKIGVNAMLILTKEVADEAKFTQWPEDNEIEILYTIEDCNTGN